MAHIKKSKGQIGFQPACRKITILYPLLLLSIYQSLSFLPDDKADNLTCCADIATYIVSETHPKASESWLASEFHPSVDQTLETSAKFHLCLCCYISSQIFKCDHTAVLYQSHENLYTYDATIVLNYIVGNINNNVETWITM